MARQNITRIFYIIYSFNKTQKIILIVASQRLEELSAQYGFTNCVLAKSPHDDDMVEAAIAES